MRNKFDTNLLILQYNTIFIYRAHLKTAKADQSAVQSRKK